MPLRSYWEKVLAKEIRGYKAYKSLGLLWVMIWSAGE
jgi:hypothetical protein